MSLEVSPLISLIGFKLLFQGYRCHLFLCDFRDQKVPSFSHLLCSENILRRLGGILNSMYLVSLLSS